MLWPLLLLALWAWPSAQGECRPRVDPRVTWPSAQGECRPQVFWASAQGECGPPGGPPGVLAQRSG